MYGKLELFNPTSFHKDQESEAIVQYALARRVRKLAIASTGNAATSLDVYSQIHVLGCRVFL
jgi:threonine synthase